MDENSDRRLLEEYDRLQERFENLGGYNTEVELNRVANGLDIPAAMRAQLFDSLSGGEKTRVNLALKVQFVIPWLAQKVLPSVACAMCRKFPQLLTPFPVLQ